MEVIAMALRWLTQCRDTPSPEEYACASLVSVSVGFVCPDTEVPVREILRRLPAGRHASPAVAQMEWVWLQMLPLALADSMPGTDGVTSANSTAGATSSRTTGTVCGTTAGTTGTAAGATHRDVSAVAKARDLELERSGQHSLASLLNRD